MVVDGQKLLARVGPHTWAKSVQQIDVMFNLNRARLFDPNTNLAIDLDIPEGLREEARAHAETG